MAGRMSQEVRADPNLTPMLDMVFQLITFFMLVMTFKSAEIDFNLRLPVVGSARPVSNEGRTGLLVLNVDSNGNLRTTQTIRDIDAFLARLKPQRDAANDARREAQNAEMSLNMVRKRLAALEGEVQAMGY